MRSASIFVSSLSARTPKLRLCSQFLSSRGRHDHRSVDKGATGAEDVDVAKAVQFEDHQDDVEEECWKLSLLAGCQAFQRQLQDLLQVRCFVT